MLISYYSSNSLELYPFYSSFVSNFKQGASDLF